MYIYDTITETVVEFYYRDLNTPSIYAGQTETIGKWHSQ